ncbi:CRISPR system Cascade subunit CasA [Roseateles asaccharophilus]|uniref:type I-E CRISPR-associated protein Cse1/CasA n=1 Tax=Roseateles asaccharophilus TaxID=582607 RepID=UPI003837FF75
MHRFNLLDETWLPVRFNDGSVRSLGLLDVVRHSATISALAETAPTSLIAEYRLLLAIVHRALTKSKGVWKDADRVHWFQEGLPVDEICSYLECWRDRFWVVHPEHPFLQVAALATADETRDKRKPWTQISLASASGNAPVMFDHSLDSSPSAITWQSAVAHLLGFLQFIPGGLVRNLRDSDKAGALVNTAAVLPVGEDLAATLCLALHGSPLPSQITQDLPAWERPPLTIAELRGNPVLATGPNDRYTRQSRAVLLLPEEDGQVRWLRFAAGLALADDPQAPDPMACFREGANGLVRVGFVEGRAVWRDLPALLPAPPCEGGGKFRPAQVVESAAALQARLGHGRRHQPLLVAGMASDQDNILRWRAEQFPLPEALLTDPDRARELRGFLALTEALLKTLRLLAVDMVAGTLPDPKSKDTRSRARETIERGPLTATYFATAERELGALMEAIGRGDSAVADALWQQALYRAANLAWKGAVASTGSSARVLMSEASCWGRFQGLLRQHLPAGVSVTAKSAAVEQPEEA